ncbi:DUF6894 family protein [Caulobacter hibisci]|uniref:DUF6894 domain-containing protein n=1 Tax=Caulobacter hibisci TaxID=2035993 RepID=A0ABS0SZP3_9CAUL|nr:hypothetical protein [Caulobacter hibisci]MBI1684133.1 hypothetical protein [Caulobacter hibisci]
MTHFYFHTWRGDQRLADDVGLELRDSEQAQDLAARDLGEMARDLLHGSSQAARLGIDIADAGGVVLARLTLVFTLEERP